MSLSNEFKLCQLICIVWISIPLIQRDSSFIAIIVGYQYDIFRWLFFKSDLHDLNRADAH